MRPLEHRRHAPLQRSCSAGAQQSEPDVFDSDEDALKSEEVRPQGGTWNGLLFDNPSIGLPPALTWTFSFACAEVSRDDESSPVSLTVDWVPLPGATWLTMAGHTASCDSFGEPVECSAYFFEHYRYDAVRLRAVEQQQGRLRVAVEARDDIDDLGVPVWTLDQWLAFEGIYVQLEGVRGLADATASLQRFTDPSGLTAVDNGHNLRLIGPGAREREPRDTEPD